MGCAAGGATWRAKDHRPGWAGELVAVSGACSHQGCLLRLNEAAARLDCPCHRTAFSSGGRLLFHQLDTASPPPLARLQVRRNGDAIEVLLPNGTPPQPA